jgi:hypothetical protein
MMSRSPARRASSEASQGSTKASSTPIATAIARLPSAVAMSLRIPAWIRTLPAGWHEGAGARAEPPRQTAAVHPPIESRSRAAAIVDAVAVHQRREAALESTGSRAAHIARGAGRHERGERQDRPPAIGSPGRRTRQRVSAHAIARDKRS